MLDTLVDDLGAFSGPASLQYMEAWKRLKTASGDAAPVDAVA